jgi:2-polyprenyl-3-methyl-5-hydroxy-6-metoxy-1,4-benzoquinol methylase
LRPQSTVAAVEVALRVDSSLLVRLLGFPATLLHGDTLVLDRWIWLRRRLPRPAQALRLIDVGCGSGAFTIGAARRGYRCVGLSWDARNQQVATRRAALCNATAATFEIMDVRQLGAHPGFRGVFDIAICLESIEHVIDDGKLMRDICGCLHPGGRLLLTTPNFDYRPITRDDDGPFLEIEDGRHVRRGYTRQSLARLCEDAGLAVERISYCSGFFSQKVTWLFRVLSRHHPLLGWLAVLPLRPLAPILDPLVARFTHWPYFSICLEATKPRDARGTPCLA